MSYKVNTSFSDASSHGKPHVVLINKRASQLKLQLHSRSIFGLSVEEYVGSTVAAAWWHRVWVCRASGPAAP